ncbi:MAG: asparagine synthase (glutamine-hydrolyzing) [Geminicoccaceae bacterium]|nr:asparagine synthase (glutamine-hydrolyzing) [Geminicoccaceae bacterium]
MCGFAGFLQPSTAIDHDRSMRIVRAMAAPIDHRGPDSEGALVDAGRGLALAFRRLAIMDLSEAGHQPMVSRTGRLSVMFNGEIYNSAELRERVEAKGIALRGHSDTEAMVEHMALFGIEKTIGDLVGMFAIAVFDRDDGRLVLVRDRLGIKPLYWAKSGNGILFASQPKCFLAHPDFRPEADERAIAQFLRYGYVPAPFSIYRGVAKLEPGHMLVINADGRISDRAWWDLAAIAEEGALEPLAIGDEEALERYSALLDEAVGMRMVADVPLGAFLSGGIDSSLTVARMQKLSSRPVKTFTIGFSDPRFDESHQALRIAELLGTEHHPLTLDPADAMALVPKLPDWFDEPFADSSQLPTLLVSRLAREHVTVSLSGDGGDELFAGYTRYADVMRLQRRLRVLPGTARNWLSGSADRFSRRTGAIESLGRAVGTELRLDERAQRLAMAAGTSSAMLMRDILSHWRDPDRLFPGIEEPVGEAWRHTTALSSPSDMQLCDMRTYLPEDILAKVDRASMAFSLEARVPLLDHRLVEFVWRLDAGKRHRPGPSKWLLRELLARDLPRDLFLRPKKGFSIPVHEWLRGPMRDWAESLLAPATLSRLPGIDVSRAREIWDQHVEGRADRRFELWNLLMLASWNERWMVSNEGSPDLALSA